MQKPTIDTITVHKSRKRVLIMPDANQVNELLGDFGVSQEMINSIIQLNSDQAIYKSENPNYKDSISTYNSGTLSYMYLAGMLDGDDIGKLIAPNLNLDNCVEAYERMYLAGTADSDHQKNWIKNTLTENYSGDAGIELWLARVVGMSKFSPQSYEGMPQDPTVQKLSILLACPGYLISASPSEQKHFFKIYFELLSKSKYSASANDINSSLWKYLTKIFPGLEALNKYKPNPLAQHAQHTKVVSGNVISRGIGLESLPREEDIAKILRFLGYDIRKKGLLELLSMMQENHNSTPIRKTSDTSGNTSRDLALGYLAGNISGDIFGPNMPIKRDKEGIIDGHPFYEYLMLAQYTHKDGQKDVTQQFYEALIMGEDVETSGEDELETLAAGAALISYERSIVQEYFESSGIIDNSLMLLIHPGFLTHTTKEQQKRFFGYFLDALKGRGELNEKDSFIWKYLLTYFGHIPELIDIYTNVFKHEAFDNIQAAKQRKLTDEEQKRKKHLLELIGNFGNLEDIDSVMQLHVHIQNPGTHETITSSADLAGRDLEEVALLYLGGRINPKVLQGFDISQLKEPNCDPSHVQFYVALLGATGNKIAQVNTLANFNRKLDDTRQDSPIYGKELKYLVLGINLLRIQTKVVDESEITDTDKFRALMSLLVYPDYLNNTNSGELNRFNKMLSSLLISLGIDGEALMYLHIYITNYFPEGYIKILGSEKEKYKLPSKETRESKGILQGLGLRDHQEGLINILGKMNALREVEDVGDQNLEHDELIGLLLAGRITYEYFSKVIQDNAFSAETDGDRVSMAESLSLGSSMSQDDQIGILQRVVSQQDETLKSGTYLQASLYTALLLRLDIELVNNSLDDIYFIQISTCLLIDRTYLKSISSFERERFFELWFIASRDETFTNNPHSKIWEYILEHFGDVVVVKNKHSELTQQIPDLGANTNPKEGNTIELYEQVDTSNISIVAIGSETYKLDLWPVAPEGANACLVVWTKSKSGILKDPRFYTIQEADTTGFEFKRGQLAQIGCIEQGRDLCKANYTDQQQCFVAIRVPVPQKEKAQKPANPQRAKHDEKKNTKITTKPESRSNIEKSQGPDQEALEIGILITLQDGDISYEVTQDGKVVFSLPQGESYVQDSGYQNLCTTRDIVYDISGTKPVLLSFLGINKFDISEIDLNSELDTRLSVALKELEELKNSDDQKVIYNSIASITAFPKIYKEALGFFRACEAGHLLNRREDKLEAIWLGPISQPIKNSIENELSQRGFGIKFDGGTITISSNDCKDKVVFNVSSGIKIEEMNTMQGTTTNTKNIAIARYLLEQVLSVIIFGYYKNNKAKSTVTQEINKKKIKREGVLKETKTRINSGKADFITGWDPEGRNDVNEYIASISSKSILGKRGFLQIGNSPLTDIKREEIYNEIEAQMFESKSTYLLDYFFDRIRATHGLDSQFSEIGKDQGAYIVLGMNIINWEMKTQICREVLNRLRNAKVSIVLMEPISFSYNELLGN